MVVAEGLRLAKGSLLVEGVWQEGSGSATVDVVNPATEQQIALVSEASPQEVDAACASARRAFDSGPWPRMDPHERRRILNVWVDLLERERERFASLLVEEVGTPILLARSLQVDIAVEQGRWLADAAARGPRGGWQRGVPLHHQPVVTTSLFVQETVGVVAAITAYNFPVVMFVAKVFSALAAGCTTVVLPSPRTPLITLEMAALADEAGVPPGVVNVVVGGPAVGQRLTEHPGVDLVSFTGSVEVGRQIMAQASTTLKKVVLELGGKSANIILEGAELDAVVAPSILRFARNAGQGCSATTRILVPRDRYGEFVERARALIATLRVGDPWDLETDVGPLIRGNHRDRVEGFVQRAVDAGAVIEAGGGRPDLPTGYFMNVTLIGGVANDVEICQEELFGPVGVVLPYDEVDEAIAIANDTKYGLSGNVFGPTDQAIEVARRIRSGTVTINGGGGLRPDAPYGGFRHSGLGRELGEEGFLEMFELKTIQWPIAGIGIVPGTRK